MDCECGGHQFGSQPCHMDCECGHYLSPSPVTWVMSVVVISLGPNPAIWFELGGSQFGSQAALWIVSVVIIGVPVMPHGL